MKSRILGYNYSKAEMVNETYKTLLRDREGNELLESMLPDLDLVEDKVELKINLRKAAKKVSKGFESHIDARP